MISLSAIRIRVRETEGIMGVLVPRIVLTGESGKTRD